MSIKNNRQNQLAAHHLKLDIRITYGKPHEIDIYHPAI